MRPLTQWAMSEQLIEAHPTLGIKIKLPQTEGHLTWSESRSRSLNCAGQSAQWSDSRSRSWFIPASVAVASSRWGTRTSADGVLTWKQIKKTKAGRVPVESRCIPSWRKRSPPDTVIGQTTFLVKLRGKPFSEREFNCWFREARDAALAGECVPHGLRKGCCRCLADLGLPPHRIAAFSGHVTLKGPSLYEITTTTCG